MQGLYSLIQYSETPERAEFINVGAVLFLEAEPSVLVRFSEDFSRVEDVFHIRLNESFEMETASLERRLQLEFEAGWNREQIERFISMRAGKLRFTPPRAILVEDGMAVMERLMKDFVMPVRMAPA